MDDPVSEIPSVIHALVSTPPSTQRHTIDKYFLPDASFTHPFCRTGSYSHSRDLIHGIYRWYKIMSPRIDLKVHAVAYHKQSETLYVDISQVFSIWAVPFYKAPVSLVTVLKLHRSHDDGRYYLKSQEDLYQTSEFIKFVLPFGIGFALVWLWQIAVTLLCRALAWLFWPVTWAEEQLGMRGHGGLASRRGRIQNVASELLEGVKLDAGRVQKKDRINGADTASRAFERAEWTGTGSGLVTAPSVEQR